MTTKPRDGQGLWRRTTLLPALLLAAATAGWHGAGHAQDVREAPFGNAVSSRIPFYDRVMPMIATAGPLGRLGVMEAKGVGFRAIVNLRPDPEASENEENVAEFALLRYFNVPVSATLPDENQLQEIAGFLKDPDNLPVLMHGIDRDQAAAAWALHRAAQGVPPEVAFEEGQAAGLRERAGAVRERLGLPPQ